MRSGSPSRGPWSLSTSAPPSAAQAPERGGYGRSAAVVSVGFGATGLVTFAFFALASHALSPSQYGGVSPLWAGVFATTSVLYPPRPPPLSRTIADPDVGRGEGKPHPPLAGTLPPAPPAPLL